MIGATAGAGSGGLSGVSSDASGFLSKVKDLNNAAQAQAFETRKEGVRAGLMNMANQQVQRPS